MYSRRETRRCISVYKYFSLPFSYITYVSFSFLYERSASLFCYSFHVFSIPWGCCGACLIEIDGRFSGSILFVIEILFSVTKERNGVYTYTHTNNYTLCGISLSMSINVNKRMCRAFAKMIIFTRSSSLASYISWRREKCLSLKFWANAPKMLSSRIRRHTVTLLENFLFFTYTYISSSRYVTSSYYRQCTLPGRANRNHTFITHLAHDIRRIPIITANYIHLLSFLA